MADIYKQDGSRNWYMRLRDEHGKLVRRSTRTADKDAARVVLAREMRAVELRRIDVHAPSPLHARAAIGGVIEAYLADCLAGGNTPQWVVKKRGRLHAFVDAARVRSVSEIGVDAVRGFFDGPLASRSLGTRRAYKSIISDFCKWAIEQRPPMLSADPTLGAIPRRRGHKLANIERVVDSRRCLWTHEIPMLLNAAPADPRARLAWDHHRRPLYIVALGTGLRRSTLSRITSSMIRLDNANPHIAVPGELMKSGRLFHMPLRDPMVLRSVRELVRRCALRKPFSHGRPNPLLGRPLAPVPKSETFQADLERAGIPLVDEQGRRVVFHSLRATFATQLALSDVPDIVTQQLMDHQDIHTTKKYYAMVGVTDAHRFMARMPALESVMGGMFETMLA